jgi:hypothetical protein
MIRVTSSPGDAAGVDVEIIRRLDNLRDAARHAFPCFWAS